MEESKTIDQLTRLELADILSGLRVQEPSGRSYSLERIEMRLDVVWVQLIQLPEETLRSVLRDYMRTHSMTDDMKWIVR